MCFTTYLLAWASASCCAHLKPNYSFVRKSCLPLGSLHPAGLNLCLLFVASFPECLLRLLGFLSRTTVVFFPSGLPSPGRMHTFGVWTFLGPIGLAAQWLLLQSIPPPPPSVALATATSATKWLYMFTHVFLLIAFGVCVLDCGPLLIPT